MKGKNDLLTWMRRQLYVERPEGQPARFVLKHVGAGNKLGSEVTSIQIPKDPSKRDDAFLESSLIELENSANQDASGLGGVQSYVVQAFFSGEEKPLARYTFKVQGTDEDEEGSSMGSEPPNRVGITSQLMRHQEAIFRTSVMGTGQVISTLMRQNQMLSDLMEKSMTRQMEASAMIEELLSHKHERELAAKAQDEKQAMLRDAFEKVMTLAPVVVAKLTKGKNGSAGDATALEVQIRGLLETIGPDQFESLSGALKPEQQLALAEIYQGLQEADAKRKEEKEKRNGAKALKGKES